MITLKHQLNSLEREIGVVASPITIIVKQYLGRLAKPESRVIETKDGPAVLTVKHEKANWPKARAWTDSHLPSTTPIRCTTRARGKG